MPSALRKSTSAISGRPTRLLGSRRRGRHQKQGKGQLGHGGGSSQRAAEYLKIKGFSFDSYQVNPYYRAPMSATTLPQYIDAQKWADREAAIDQVFPLAAFARLCESTTGNEGDVRVNCRVRRDAQSLIVLEGKLSTTLSLTCQRCLEPVMTELEADVQLWLLRDEDAAEQLSDEADYLVQDGEGRVALADVLEDELILALPLVAAHEECELCQIVETEDDIEDEVVEVETPQRENPFQALTGFKVEPAKK